jgi:hypothetical protein
VRAALAAASSLLLALAVACSGSDDGQPQAQGFASPQAAVRALIDGMVRRDREAFLLAVDPDFRTRPAELGILVGVALPQLTGREPGEIAFRDLTLRAVYEEDRNYASVLVSGLIEIAGRQTLVTDEPLFALRKGENWYVTSPSLPYWSSRLRTRPSEASQTQLDDSPSLPGQYVPPYAGLDGVLGTNDDRSHVAAGAVVPFCAPGQSGSVCYSSNPPTSGVHAPTAAPFGVLPAPASKESLVHSMEHGGVVVWYNTTDAAVVRDLTAVVSSARNRGDLVVMSAYGDMEAETIALTAWTRLDKFPASEFSARRVDDFIRAHSRRFNPEGF